MLLLCAAGLKLAGQNVSAVPQVGWYATPMVQMAAAEWELVLGIWLLSGRYRIGSWLASVATFFTFAGISGYLGFVGVASCGCFGAIKASPWYAFGVDVIALLFLGLFRPDFSSLQQLTRSECRRLALNAAAYALALGGLFAVLAGAATWAYGSPEAALARLRGELIIVYPRYLDLGPGKPGEAIEKIVEVQNFTDNSIRLVGGTSDCSCVTTASLPAVVAPGQALKIKIKMKIPIGSVGAITRIAALWTDCDRQRTATVIVACQIQE